MKTNIIIVDDSLDYATLLSHCFLDREDISVILFSDSSKALEYLRDTNKHKDTLVVTDIIMPGLNGIEFISEVKKISKEFKVCFLTNCRDSQVIENAFSIGACDYILKDRTKDEIVYKINLIIDNDLKETPEHIEVYEISEVLPSYELIKTSDSELVISTSEEVSVNSIVKLPNTNVSKFYKVENCEIDEGRTKITCKAI